MPDNDRSAPSTAKESIAWFESLGRTDTATAGGKGANLGELTEAGLPVPPGFVVLASGYLAAMDAAGLRDELTQRFDEIDLDDHESLEATCGELSDAVRATELPDAVRTALAEAYQSLGDDVAVAVRSSATAEDGATASFAGMNESYTDVEGIDELAARVVDCWASLWSPRAVSYRKTKGLDDEPAIAVVVQQMVSSECSGVLFTADPGSGDRTRLVIEAAFGLGEVVVGGQVEPDTYVVDRTNHEIASARIGHQSHKLVRAEHGDERVDLGDDADRRVLPDELVLTLAEMGERIEDHYGTPQDVEFAIADGDIWIVQARPITTLADEAKGDASGSTDGGGAKGDVLLEGLGAAPGVVSGKVRLLDSPSEGSRLEAGEVLVAP